MDIRLLDSLEIVRTANFFPSATTAALLMSSYGKASHKRQVAEMYSNVLGEVYNYTDGQSYCIVNHKSSDTCCLLGEPKEIYYILEESRKNNYTTLFFDEYDIETGKIVMVLTPTKALFCEIEVDE